MYILALKEYLNSKRFLQSTIPMKVPKPKMRSCHSAYSPPVTGNENMSAIHFEKICCIFHVS